MKRKLLFAALCVVSALGFNVNAQVDITSTYLTNAGLSTVDNGWTYYSDSFKYTDWKTDGDVPVVEFYSQWNAGNPVTITQKDFKFSQTVTLPAGDYRIAVNAFYRNGNGDGTNPDKAWIFAGDKKQNVAALTSAGVASYTGSNDLYKAANAFSRGDFSNAFDFSLEEETEISLGFQGFFNTSLSWCILGPVKLYKYSLENYLVDYRAKVAEAEALYDDPMNADVLTALKAAVVEESSFSLSSEVIAAIATLTTKITDANSSISIYSSINDAISNYATSAAALDEAGAAAYNASAIQTKYDNGTYVTLAEAETDLTAALVAATKAQTTENSNWTGTIINPSFESDFSNGWTNTGSFARQGNDSFAKTGAYYAEFWEPNGTKTLTQTITDMPAGVYRLTAHAKARGVTSAKLFAEGINTPITIADSDDDYSVEFACDADADVELGFEGVGTGAGNSWLCVDNFRLTLVSAGLPDVEAVTGKMNADVATAQTSAIAAYNAEKTVANYNAASAAIAAAQASKEAYAKAATAIADANALKEAHNFASATATTTFADAIAAISDAYDDGTLSDADATAAGLTLGTAVSGWHANASAAAVAYISSAWSEISMPNNADWSAYYINTWSTEGGTDGSNFKVPFYEYWIADGESLAAKTMTGTLTGLDNGLYTVSAWVRVRAKNEVAATDATGITMDINGGGEGDYAAVDVTEGTQIVTSQFQIATYTAQGLVKDGTLTLNFNVAADNNISWLSFKNISYTKVRDLTAEEMAVVPADLAIDATSTVFKGKTATLTATSTTEGASIDGFVNWTSDNTSVATVDANGVVTGVAYGTANITATSSLNAAATATCAVTVTAPLITDAANLDFAEGPVVSNHIRTYAKDKTGTDVAQMQEVTGWSIVSNGDAKAAGVMAYGSSYGMGSNSSDFYAPATNPDGQATGNVMGMVGVWSGSVQYVQNVKLPAGAYTITVPVYRNGGANALTKNLIGVILDNGTEYLATTTVYDNSWKTETIKFTVAEETYGRLSLGLNAPNKGSADCQRLWIDGVTVTFEPFATAEEIAALNAAITTAEGYALGFDKDDYAPYKNVAAVTALATAKALDTTNPIAQSDVTNATTALTSATWTANTEEVNAVYDGTFAAAENNGAPAGWTMSNNTLGGSYHARAFVGDERLSEFNSTNSGFYLRFDGTNSNRGSMYYYGNTAGYTVPLKEGVTYYVKVDVAGWGSTGKPIRMNVTGPEGFTSVGDQVNTSVQADNSSDAPQQIFFTFTASVAGNYVINFQTPGADTNTHAVVISNLELKRVLEISEDATSAPTAVDYANVTLTRTLKGGQWNGFSVPFGFTIAGSALEGAEVKEFDEANGNEITLKDATEIVAGNPYLVKPASDIVNPIFKGVSVTAATDVVKGEGDYTFQAHLYATDLAIDGSVAYMSTTDSKIKKLTSGSIKGLRAIFNIPVSSSAKALVVRFDNTPTGILAVDAEGNVYEGAIYNLAGQKLNAPVKGINIIGGKKVVVK